MHDFNEENVYVFIDDYKLKFMKYFIWKGLAYIGFLHIMFSHYWFFSGIL